MRSRSTMTRSNCMRGERPEGSSSAVVSVLSVDIYALRFTCVLCGYGPMYNLSGERKAYGGGIRRMQEHGMTQALYYLVGYSRGASLRRRTVI